MRRSDETAGAVASSGRRGGAGPFDALRFISVTAAIRALVCLAFLMDARRMIAWAIRHNGGVAVGIIDGLDYLTFAEWAVILIAVARINLSALRLPPGALAVLFLFASYALVGVDPRSHILTVALCLGLAGFLAVKPISRGLAVCLALVSLQFCFNFESWPFILCARIDAIMAHVALAVSGYPAELNGIALGLRGAGHVVEVGGGCSTLATLSTVIAGALIFVFARIQAPGIRIAPRLLSMISFVAIINWLRLAAMALSPDYYAFLHGGFGSEALGMLYAVLAFWTSLPASPCDPQAGSPKDIVASGLAH